MLGLTDRVVRIHNYIEFVRAVFPQLKVVLIRKDDYVTYDTAWILLLSEVGIIAFPMPIWTR